MALVTGHILHGEPATLSGHVRHPVRGEDYPGLVPDAGGRVEGVLYRDLPEAGLARLDCFEGEMYERRRVRVNPVGGGDLEAWCYIFRPEFAHRLLPGEWDFAAFLAGGKQRFMARYVGFDALK